MILFNFVIVVRNPQFLLFIFWYIHLDSSQHELVSDSDVIPSSQDETTQRHDESVQSKHGELSVLFYLKLS